MSDQCKFTLVLAVVAMLLMTSLPASSYQPQHPVFPAQLSEDQVSFLKGDVAAVMQFSPEKIDEFVPARTGHYNIDCPNCEAGNPQRVGWQWSVEDPDHLTCGYCGMVFPNDQYPLNRVTTVTDGTGTVHDYAYYEGKNGYKHYILMHVDYSKKAYMENSAAQIARLYAATGEAQYARQAALILNRLAEVYPHYNVHGITDFTTCASVIYDLKRLPTPADGLQPVPGLAKDLKGYETPYPYCSTLRGDGIDNWFYDEMCPHLAYAYDLVASSDEFDKLSAALGKDVRRNIEGFFRATANYTRTFPIYLGNVDPILILFGLDATSQMQAAGLPIKATTRYAFVRTQQGQVARMLIVDGTALTFGDTTLSAPPAPAGRVLAVRRVEAGDHEDALIVDTSITPRKGKPHERVIVEFGDGSTFGLGVREIREFTGVQSVIVLGHRPGFEFSTDGATATQTHHPHHTMPGRPHFRLVNVADWARE